MRLSKNATINMDYYSNFFPLLIIILIVSSCNKDNGVNYTITSPPNPGAQFCDLTELDVITDGATCADGEVPGFYIEGVCARVSIDETLYLDEIAYDWSPEICDWQLGSQITFRNEQDVTTWDVVKKEHYISEEKATGGCEGSNALSIAIICQKNEVIHTSFLSDLLGPDTIQLELKAHVRTIQEQSVVEKINTLNFGQLDGEGLVNFWLEHKIGDEYSDNGRQAFFEEITLDGVKYNDVLMRRFGDSLYADPHTWFYLQREVGILGFEVDGKLWVRE